MIHFTKGNMMTSTAEALVNTVNTVGVMGKGIALQFKEEFPANFAIYKTACSSGHLVPGKLLITREINSQGIEKTIINFPTKLHWRNPSKYEYIRDGLAELAKALHEYNIKSIAIPPLGCGNGGLNWDIVRNMITETLEKTNVEIYIYEPNTNIKQALQIQSTSKDIKLTPSRGLITYAMYYYDSLGEDCSLFVANKLAYFLQRQGSQAFANIKFQAHHYGPYSHKIDHLIYGLNGSYIKGFEQMNATAFEPLTMQHERRDEISKYVRTLNVQEQNSLKATINLISGFESTLALEILASVDFIRQQNPGINLADTITAIQNWSDRKTKLFKDEYIQIAYDHLDTFCSCTNELF
jgi:O-acetyl-ADP-ribose deacetylase (regulator of RNase III)